MGPCRLSAALAGLADRTSPHHVMLVRLRRPRAVSRRLRASTPPAPPAWRACSRHAAEWVALLVGRCRTARVMGRSMAASSARLAGRPAPRIWPHWHRALMVTKPGVVGMLVAMAHPATYWMAVAGLVLRSRPHFAGSALATAVPPPMTGDDRTLPDCHDRLQHRPAGTCLPAGRADPRDRLRLAAPAAPTAPATLRPITPASNAMPLTFQRRPPARGAGATSGPPGLRWQALDQLRPDRAGMWCWATCSNTCAIRSRGSPHAPRWGPLRNP